MRLLPGYEPLLQAYSGLMMMNGDEGGPPTRVGTSILDYGTGMWAAIGILAALVRRGVTGRGCVVDASLYETGLAWLKGHHASFSTSGIVPERHRTGSHRVVPFESFETSTGPIIVAAGNDRLFAKLAGILGRTAWARARAEPARRRPGAARRRHLGPRVRRDEARPRGAVGAAARRRAVPRRGRPRRRPHAAARAVAGAGGRGPHALHRTVSLPVLRNGQGHAAGSRGDRGPDAGDLHDRPGRARAS